MGSRARIIVTVSRTYEYPKAVLRTGDEQNDAQQRAYQDVANDMEEYARNFTSIDPNTFFKTRINEESGFKLRKPAESTKDSAKIPIGDAVKNLVIYDLEAKYGPLDAERNPEIFYSDSGRPDREPTFYLRGDIEEQYNILYNRYWNILRGLIE